jgi:hypothetical protein
MTGRFTRLGELALVDGERRIGPLDTVAYNTLLDENDRAISRSATASRSWWRAMPANAAT